MLLILATDSYFLTNTGNEFTDFVIDVRVRCTCYGKIYFRKLGVGYLGQKLGYFSE